MTNQQPTAGRPASRLIPWLAAFGALAVFFITLNQWVSFLNLAEIVKASRLSWQSDLYFPAYRLVTWPLHFLPAKWIPLALNMFSAICGAAVLGLLARSVMLLPHDRTQEQRLRQTNEHAFLSIPLAWLPPLLAAAVCGLQLTFWEHSTNATAETFNLLLLAYAIRSLLEYRVHERESWLYRAAFCYGAAMPNDWLVVGLFPGFVIAIIWLRGLSFFNLRFLVRTLLWGLLGLSLYALLPALVSFAKGDEVGFWDALKMNLAWQKFVLTAFPRKTFLLLFLYSLVPVILLSIQWASYFGDSSPIGVAFATAIFHLAHLAFLFGCIWVFFDPQFSPRHQNLDAFSFLLLYYLAALAVGYFSGYLLLVFREVIVRGRRPSSALRLLSKAATAMVIALGLGAPIALLIVNLPSIRTSNTNRLETLARLSLADLPKNSVLLADNPAQAALAQAWLIRSGRPNDLIVAETHSLNTVGYHRFARSYYGSRWPTNPAGYSGKSYDARAVLGMIEQFVASGPVYYLHPTHGVFLEHYYIEPHGLVYRLKKYQTDVLTPQPSSPALIEENEKFWEVAKSAFPDILKVTVPRSPQAEVTLRDRIMTRLHALEPRGDEARGAGALYSRPLNYWGVELQKAGDFKRSAPAFELAQQLKPDNVVAKINLEFNKTYQSGKPFRVSEPKSVEEFFGEDVRSWDAVLNGNGPFDEPNLCYRLGREFYQKQLYRQAAQCFQRVRTFAPDDLASGLWLAELNLMANHPDRAVELTREIVEQPARFKGNTNEVTDALCMLAKALFKKGSAEEAERLLEMAAQKVPPDPYLLADVTATYRDSGRYSNALVNIGRQLALRPDEPASLFAKGLTQINLNDCEGAITTFTHLLEVETNSPPDVMLNRAVAYFRCNKVDESRKDYETLERKHPTVPQIILGLNEIAWQRKDTNACILYCERYLSNSIPGTAETAFIQSRLRALKGLSPVPTPSPSTP